MAVLVPDNGQGAVIIDLMDRVVIDLLDSGARFNRQCCDHLVNGQCCHRFNGQ